MDDLKNTDSNTNSGAESMSPRVPVSMSAAAQQATTANAGPSGSSVVTPPVPVTSAPKKSNKIPLIIGGVAVAVVAIVGIVFGLKGNFFQGDSQAVNPLTANVAAIARTSVIPGFSVTVGHGLDVAKNTLNVDLSQAKKMNVFVDDAVVQRNFAHAYLVANGDYANFISDLAAKDKAEADASKPATADVAPPAAVPAVTQQTIEMTGGVNMKIDTPQATLDNNINKTVNLEPKAQIETRTNIIKTQETATSEVDQRAAVSTKDAQTNVFYDVASAQSAATKPADTSGTLDNAVECPATRGTNFYVSCDLSSLKTGDYKLVVDLKDSTQQVIDVTLNPGAASCDNLPKFSIAFDPSILVFDRGDQKDTTAKLVNIKTDLPQECKNKFSINLVNISNQKSEVVVASWDTLQDLENSKFATEGTSDSPALIIDSSVQAFAGKQLPAGEYDFRPFDPQSKTVLGHLQITVKDGKSSVDCTKIPQVNFTPSTIEKTQSNLSQQNTVSIANFPPDACKIDPSMTDPNGKDISGNFVFDIQNPKSFVLNSPTNANTALTKNSADVVLNFPAYADEFATPGDYSLTLNNKSNNGAQLGMVKIHVGETNKVADIVPVKTKTPPKNPVIADVAPEPTPVPAPTPEPSPVADTSKPAVDASKTTDIAPSPTPEPSPTPTPEPNPAAADLTPTPEPSPTPTPVPGSLLAPKLVPLPQPTPATPTSASNSTNSAVDCRSLVGDATYTAEDCALAQQLQKQGIITGALRPKDSIKRYEAALLVVRTLGLPEKSDCALSLYKDLDLKASYISQLCTANTAGVIKGYGNSVMLPSKTVTYREFARMLVNGYVSAGIVNVPRSYAGVAAALNFKVEKDNDWFGFALQFLVNRSVVTIDELKLVNLDSPMTRLQALQLLQVVLANIQK